MIERAFIFERATKNTYRYAEVPVNADQGDTVIGVLYVQKSAFGTTQAPRQPARLKVTVEEVK